MSNIQRTRGYRDDTFKVRVQQVVGGEYENNPTILSAAANEILKPYLTAKTANAKGGILSLRQIYRRKAHEIPLGEMTVGFYAGKYHIHDDWNGD